MSGAGSDSFASATPIAVGDTSDPTSNASLTVEAGEPTLRNGRTAWWSFTPSADVDAVISTAGSNVDTILAVYTGSSVGALTQVAYNDDYNHTPQSRVVISATAGTTYSIQVDTYDAAVGNYVVAVSAMVYGGGNDRFADAVDIAPGTTAATVDTTAYTVEPGENVLGQGRTAWWKFTAATTGTVRVDTYYSSIPTALGVYTGSSVSTTTLVKSATSTTAPVSCDIDVTAGTTYHIQVDATTSTGNTLAVSVAYLGTGGVSIPMDKPDSHFYGHATGNNTPYVAGNGGGTSDHTDLIYARSSSPNPIHLDQVGYNSDMIGRYAGGPYYMLGAGTLNHGPTFPSDYVSVSVSLTLTSRSDTTDHFFVGSFYIYDATNAAVGGLTETYFGTSATTTMTTTTSASQPITNSDPATQSAMLQAIQAGRMLVLVAPRYPHSYDPPTGADDFSDLTANFSWATYDRPPPNGVVPFVRTWLRETQRGDKGGAPFRTVQNNSRQNSLRNVGFY